MMLCGFEGEELLFLIWQSSCGDACADKREMERDVCVGTDEVDEDVMKDTPVRLYTELFATMRGKKNH